MEPQINYGNMGAQDPNSGPKVYGKSKFKGCLVIGSLILIIILGVGGYLLFKGISTVKDVYDITKNKDPFNQRKTFEDSKNVDSRFGEATFMDAVIIPSNNGNPKIWILTDASKTAIVTHKTPGKYSTGSECIDCRTRGFVFDPGENKILNQTDNPFNDLVTSSAIFEVDGKIIQFTTGYHESPPRVNTYDAYSGALLSETQDFVDKHEELKSGIIEMHFAWNPKTISFETKDGQKSLIYNPKTNKVYTDNTKMSEDIAANAPDGDGVLCGLKSKSGDKRFQLFKVTAPKKNLIKDESSYMSYMGDQEHLKVFKFPGETEIVSDKIYLQGIIYYQDDNIAVIIYVDQAGKSANRIMTCIDLKSGKEKWTVNQDSLFSFMKIDELKNSYSGFESTKDKIAVKKSGGLLALTFIGGGIMGFDPDSGKKLWAVEIH